MSSEDEDMECDAPTSFVKTNPGPMNNTLAKYNQTYLQFRKWNDSNGMRAISENVLLEYFEDVSTRSKPTTLFAVYSMLKSTFRSKENVDIGSYSRLLEFLKVKNVGYKPVKAKAFTDDEIERFVNEAPDDRWLDVKAVCAFAINGVFTKLVTVMTDHVKRYDDMILVTIPKSDTTPQCTFPITGPFVNVVQKYADLRPANVPTNRFFLTYHDDKCTTQPIGKHKFNGMARRIAVYLKLSEPERYSRYSFRKNAANLSFNTSSNQNEDADEQTSEHIELDYQTGLLKSSSFGAPRLFSAPPVSRITATNSIKSSDEHVCTFSCGQVKCASEENEKIALHAFNMMKPPEYTITDLTPALYPADPACRWIVAYTHKSDEVTTYNAEETFESITRTIPYNVRIDQKYIRGTAAQMSEAYIVVYSVNCRCQKETADVFNMLLNEAKFEDL
ncbi:uncharacterized protein LOC119066533 isoform X3 [Bradysia coprophila]|uniref:uncharacterized protein LOC119066533 isoform X3 n=1 Tax=Bradysia coprophila TaxID=38358 RepID=UPI00187D9A4A|nr:uncharacterized protein LOC119066533 isoform X3 [Bradysia coprophila]